MGGMLGSGAEAGEGGLVGGRDGGGGEDDDGQGGQGLVLGHVGDQLQPAHVGQLQAQHHHVGVLLGQGRQGLGGGGHGPHHHVRTAQQLDERTIAPSLDTFLSVIKKDGGSVEKVDIWGRRRMSFEINKKPEGIYAVIDINAEPASVIELDRQLNLNESVLRTKVIRPTPQKAKSKKAQAKAAAKKAEARKSA